MTVPIDPIAVALTIARALDGLGILHTIGGSIASSIAGEPRSTLDIDVVAALRESDVPLLVAALSPEFYVEECRRGSSIATICARTPPRSMCRLARAGFRRISRARRESSEN